MVSLYLGEKVVAQAEVSDREEPSNLALFYRGKIDSKTDFRVEISPTDDKASFINPKYL